MTAPKKKEYPKKIFLQIEDQWGNVSKPSELHDHECTWAENRINDSDLEYVSHKWINESPMEDIIEITQAKKGVKLVHFGIDEWKNLNYDIAKAIRKMLKGGATALNED